MRRGVPEGKRAKPLSLLPTFAATLKLLRKIESTKQKHKQPKQRAHWPTQTSKESQCVSWVNQTQRRAHSLATPPGKGRAVSGKPVQTRGEEEGAQTGRKHTHSQPPRASDLTLSAPSPSHY